MQGEGVAHLAIPSGGRRPRLSVKVSLETFHCTWPDRKRQKASGQQTWGCSGESIEMVLAEERREELAAVY
ncbi:hypothetical protein DPMN_013817 [Dreissena polymorpha]|uniref:Uncharacterized protein n=1 Tax=Dreissena polymorpha TaxID=45954 RepID=A0A9D4S405_DREPO|nr:hypothetical protein DPMN_013817 [Dreissena polymorpha]